MDILQQPGSKNRILSSQQIQTVHEYVLSVMENIGCKVECERHWILIFDDQTVALDVIDKVGPGNHFLLEDYTYENFKQNTYMPRYLDRKRFEEWQTVGSQELRRKLNRKAQEIFAKCQPKELSADIRSKIKNITAQHQPDAL